MNDPTNSPPPPQDNSQTNGGSFNSIPIVPINLAETERKGYEFEQATQSPAEIESEISERAKSFEASCKLLVGLLDASGALVVSKTAKSSGFSEDDCEALSDKARMDNDTVKIPLIKSSARIIARYAKTSEAVDWLTFTGALSVWASGIIIAVREIKKIKPIAPK